MSRMAAASGGAFFREEGLAKLPDALRPPSADAAASVIEVPLWSTPAYFGLIVAVLTAEWVVRKVVQLR